MNVNQVPEGMIPISEFSKLNGLQAQNIIDLIREGRYSGKRIEECWYVIPDEPQNKIQEEDEMVPHRYQSDVNKAIRAVNVGSNLNTIN